MKQEECLYFSKKEGWKDIWGQRRGTMKTLCSTRWESPFFEHTIFISVYFRLSIKKEMTSRKGKIATWERCCSISGGHRRATTKPTCLRSRTSLLMSALRLPPPSADTAKEPWTGKKTGGKVSKTQQWINFNFTRSIAYQIFKRPRGKMLNK